MRGWGLHRVEAFGNYEFELVMVIWIVTKIGMLLHASLLSVGGELSLKAGCESRDYASEVSKYLEFSVNI